jgi:hypothetical protein
MLATRLLAATALCVTCACAESIDSMRVFATNEAYARLDPVVLVDDSADSFGIESRGYFQVRGNGCLVANSTAILFVPWGHDDELWIPLDRVLSVDTTDSHLGKAKGVMLLRVRFVDEEGRQNSVAWAVKDPMRWVNALRAARGA